ncbi:MAG: HAD family hydrolase [Phycisphaerales bacterium]|nr:MAG: HAD family hydrolase [Phycisphaerales bacterium]
MITTVIFDLDDTLYDELEYCRSGFAAVAEFLVARDAASTTERVFDALWGQFTAGNRSRTFNAALDKLGIDRQESTISELVNTYRSHVPAIVLPPDSGEVLRELSEKYTLGLLTDGFLPAQQLKVEALGIEKYFESIVYTEQLGRDCWKPSPAGFERILQDLRARPENAVYVADNELKDFIAPNSLGFVTVQLLRPARIRTSTCARSGASATHVIGQITRLPALLDAL